MAGIPVRSDSRIDKLWHSRNGQSNDYHVTDCNTDEAEIPATVDSKVSSSGYVDGIPKVNDDAADTILECSTSGLDGSSLIT
jgi:hypothetical protein